MTILAFILFDWFWSAHSGLPRLFGGMATPLLLVAWLLEFHYKGWIQFAAVMRLRDARDAKVLSPEQTFLGNLVLFVGLFWDFVLMLMGCLWLWDRPREWLLSPKLERIVYNSGLPPDNWRYRRALWFRSHLLDNVDSRGVHRA